MVRASAGHERAFVWDAVEGGLDGDRTPGSKLKLGVEREQDVGSAAVAGLDGGLEFVGLRGSLFHGWNYGAGWWCRKSKTTAGPSTSLRMTAHFLPRVVQEEQNSRRSFDFAQDDGFIFAACERQKRVLRFAQDDNSFLAAGGAGRTNSRGPSTSLRSAQDDGFILAARERQKRVLRFAQDDNSFLAAGGAGRTKQPQVLRLRFAPLRMTASFLLPARDRSRSG
jgi:hypothetical protein